MFYPEEIIEEVRLRNDIVEVISSYVKLQRKGNSHIGLCPFHNEKSPSFSVNAPRQMYHCFGCGVGGNVFTFLMEYENYSFIEAVQVLAQRAGVELPHKEESEEVRKQADLRSQLLEINKVAANYFYYQLKTDSGNLAYQYLKQRSLSNEIIKKFGLGYSNKYSDDLYQYLKKKGYNDSVLRESGLISMTETKGIYDKFWNRVMFPIMDINQKVIGFGGRVMGDGKPKYLNSPETKIFDKGRNLYGLNFARLSRERKIFLCEGYMDVIALHQAGFINSVASLGTSLTNAQAMILKRYADEIIITYDSDSAGIEAALRAIPILRDTGLSIKVLCLKPYKDPDEFIKELGREAFIQRADQASNYFYFEIDVLENKYDFNDPEQKTKFFNEVAKKMLVFREELERNNYIEAVARKYNVSFEDLRKLVNKLGSELILKNDYETRSREDYNQKKKYEDGILQSQRMVLTWLSEDYELFQKLDGILAPEDFREEPFHQVATMLFEQYHKEKMFHVAKMINLFESKEEQTQVASLFNMPLREELSKLEKEKALNEMVIRIKKNSLEYASKHAIDVMELQNIIKQQRQLQSLHISL